MVMMKRETGWREARDGEGGRKRHPFAVDAGSIHYGHGGELVRQK